MRVNDWYFRNWEKRTDGNGKTQLVYTGEYYSFSGGSAPVKKGCTALIGGILVLYLLSAFFPSAGGMWRFAAVPQLLELIPLMYLCIGIVTLWRVPERMTYRDYHGSWQRIGLYSMMSLIITILMVLAELIYFIISEEIDPIREMLFFLGVLGCAVLSGVLVRFVKAHPCEQTN